MPVDEWAASIHKRTCGDMDAFNFEIELLNEVDARFQRLSEKRMQSAIEDLRLQRATLNEVEGKKEQGRP